MILDPDSLFIFDISCRRTALGSSELLFDFLVILTSTFHACMHSHIMFFCSFLRYTNANCVYNHLVVYLTSEYCKYEHIIKHIQTSEFRPDNLLRCYHSYQQGHMQHPLPHHD